MTMRFIRGAQRRVNHMLNNNENEREIPTQTVPVELLDDCEKARRALQEWQERAERRQREIRTQLYKQKINKNAAA
jgi:hypothetical protein